MDTVLFVISKLATPFGSPLFLALAAWAIVLLRLRKRERSGRRRALWIIWGALFALSLPVVSELAVRLWEVPPPAAAPVPAGGGAWPVAVVLGGGVEPTMSRDFTVTVNDAADRLETAARLWQAGQLRRIIVTGGSGNLHDQVRTEGPLMVRLLTGFGVPAAAVAEEAVSRNTAENAAGVAGMLTPEERNGGVLLITSALHMRRSQAVFAKQGLAVTPLSCDTRAEPVVFPESFVPSARSLERLSMVLREMVGYGYYRLLGRL